MTLSRMRLTRSPLGALGQAAGFESRVARAAALGISVSHLSHVERGDVRASVDLMDRMAEVYKVHAAKVERAANLCREELARQVIARVRGVAD
jgi:transcriptional regulator with XRE-family HTH domain